MAGNAKRNTTGEFSPNNSQMGGFAAELEDALGIPVNLVPTRSLDSKFLNSISDDEVLLYEAS